MYFACYYNPEDIHLPQVLEKRLTPSSAPSGEERVSSLEGAYPFPLNFGVRYAPSTPPTPTPRRWGAFC